MVNVEHGPQDASLGGQACPRQPLAGDVAPPPQGRQPPHCGRETATASAPASGVPQRSRLPRPASTHPPTDRPTDRPTRRKRRRPARRPPPGPPRARAPAQPSPAQLSSAQPGPAPAPGTCRVFGRQCHRRAARGPGHVQPVPRRLRRRHLPRGGAALRRARREAERGRDHVGGGGRAGPSHPGAGGVAALRGRPSSRAARWRVPVLGFAAGSPVPGVPSPLPRTPRLGCCWVPGTAEEKLPGLPSHPWPRGAAGRPLQAGAGRPLSGSRPSTVARLMPGAG